MNIHVRGGTNGGWRNPFAGQPMPWQCDCTVQFGAPTLEEGVVLRNTVVRGPIRKTNPGFLRRCPDCGTKRPC